MAWVTAIWSTVAAVAFAVAIAHLRIWTRRRDRDVHFYFAMMGLAVAVEAALELALMKAPTPASYAATLRMTQVPILVLATSLIGVVWTYLRVGRASLAWTVIALRATCLLLAFTTGDALHYRQILSLRQIVLLGEPVMIVDRMVINHWSRVAEFSNILLVVFVLEAAVRAYWRGDRRRAVVVSAAVVLGVVIAAGHTVLVHLGVVHTPYIVGITYLGVVLLLEWELSLDIIREARLAEQMQARVVRQEEEARMRAAIEASPSGMLMVDVRGTIGLVNSEVEKIFGYSRDELLGRSIEMLLPPAMQAAYLALSQQYFAEPRPHLVGGGRAVSGRRRDGVEVPVEIRLNPIRTSDGQFVLASVVDLTERRRADAELIRQRNEVAHLSRVTTLGELSGSLAHELNQPLTSILSNAQAAQRMLSNNTADPAELRDILNEIVTEDKRAGEVIRRLRMLLTRGEVQRQSLDMNELVSDVLKLLRGDLISHGVGTSVEFMNGLPRVSGDRVQLQQVMINLVVNATDAMAGVEAGHRQLLVKTQLDGSSARVTVSDRGRGILESDLERIFEPFVSTKQQGMGLGLAVCRSIITAHGGSIWATSNDGQGASLHFTIPTATGGAV